MTSTLVDDTVDATMNGALDTKEIDASSTSSDTDVSSGSDSEEGNLASPEDSFPTGLKRRRGGATAATSTDHSEPSLEKDPKAQTDTSRSKYNRANKKKSTIITTSAEGQPYTLARWVEFFVGAVFFFTPLPLVIAQIVCCTMWEGIDQMTFKVTDKVAKMNEWCGENIKLYKKMVVHPKDTFIVNTTFWLAICLPGYFLVEAFAQAQSISAGNGFIWWRAAIYNAIRIGPMYRNFMYVYVLCHKEAHSYGKLFDMPYRKYMGLQYVYNYFIGFFHGVIPGPFTESHIYNHHKYDNDPEDVYSTGAYPRDSFKQYVRYVYIWFLYALNISSIYAFQKEGKTDRALRCVAGVLYYVAGLLVCSKYVSPLFALVYVFYPLVEANILLSAVNYTWHAFIDPDDHDNDYVNSTTILDAMHFTLDEEYHVVHHQVRTFSFSDIYHVFLLVCHVIQWFDRVATTYHSLFI